MLIPHFAGKYNIEKHLFLDFPIKHLLVFLISLYQKYISPIKGFSCANRILHGGESCSCYVKRTLIEQDLITAIALSKKRFTECSLANQVINEQSDEQTVEEINTAGFEQKNQTGKTLSLKRRKFIQGIMLGFSMPLITGARGNCRCCGDLCLGPLFESEEDRKKRNN